MQLRSLYKPLHAVRCFHLLDQLLPVTLQAAAELEAAGKERDELRAQLEAEKKAAAEVAAAAEAARASLQGEVNTARQRIQAAEKARLELEVPVLSLLLLLGSTPPGVLAKVMFDARVCMVSAQQHIMCCVTPASRCPGLAAHVQSGSWSTCLCRSPCRNKAGT